MSAIDPVSFSKQFLNFYPLSYQQQILRSEEKRLVIRCGRQVGKSTIVSVKAIVFAYTNANKRILIIAPSQRQSSKLFRMIKRQIYRSIDLYGSIDHDEPQTATEINLTNGTTIICLPSVADTIRGESGDLIIIDEAAFIQDREIFDEVILPMLSATRGSLWLISTPKGKRGYFYKASVWAETGQYGWKEFYFPSTIATQCVRHDTGNVQIDPDFLEYQRKECSDFVYRQEYLAEFQESADNFLLSEDIYACVDENINQLSAGIPNFTYYLGVDLAKKQDKFVAIVVEKRSIYNPETKETTSVAEVVKIIEKEQTPYYIQVNIISDLMKKFNVEKAWVDRSGVGEMPYELLMMDDSSFNIEGVMMSLQKKETLYANLRACVEKRKIRYPNNPKLIKELIELSYEYTLSGQHLKIHGEHFDDYPDALALVSQCMMEQEIDTHIEVSLNEFYDMPVETYISEDEINFSTDTSDIVRLFEEW